MQDAIEEFAEMLMQAGWSEEDAYNEAFDALADAAIEDGYDGA